METETGRENQLQYSKHGGIVRERIRGGRALTRNQVQREGQTMKKASGNQAPARIALRAEEARLRISQLVAKHSSIEGLTDADRERIIAQAESIGWARIEAMFERVLRLAAAHLVNFGERSEPTFAKSESTFEIRGLD